jgi:hypothetical protein
MPGEAQLTMLIEGRHCQEIVLTAPFVPPLN